MEAPTGDQEPEPAEFSPSEIEYLSYGGEQHLPLIMSLVDEELSEPYSIFTYRYFVYLWPNLTYLAFHRGKCVGTVVCKMGEHRSTFRGYIAMLVVIKPYRGKGIATELVTRAIRVMMESGCEEKDTALDLATERYSIQTFSGDTGSRSYKQGSFGSIWPSRIYQGKEAVPLLPQWSRCLPPEAFVPPFRKPLFGKPK